MKRLTQTGQFRKDVKRMQKRGKDFGEFKLVIGALVNGQELPSRYRDHFLIGQYKGTRECHLAPDWLLIYELSEDEITLIRMGTHADLFG